MRTILSATLRISSLTEDSSMARTSNGSGKSSAHVQDDGDSGNVDQGGTETEGNGGTALAQQGSSNVEALKETVGRLQQEREQHLKAVEDIDDSLAGVQEQISQLFGNAVPQRGRPQSRSNGSRAQQRTQRQAARGTGGAKAGRGRNGGESGTAKILRILEKNKGEMASGELAAAAEEEGVKYPHSSFQSLKKRGAIELDNGTVRRLEEAK